MLTGIAEDLSATKARHSLVNKSLWCLKKDLGTRPCPRRSGCYQRFSSPFWNEPPHMDVPGHNHTVDSEKIWKSKKFSTWTQFQALWFLVGRVEIFTCFLGAIQQVHQGIPQTSHNPQPRRSSEAVALRMSERAAGRAPGSVPRTPFTARAWWTKVRMKIWTTKDFVKYPIRITLVVGNSNHI